MKTTIITVLIGILVFLAVLICWVSNAYKLTKCDFKAPFKGEIVHALGIIPILSPITVWNNDK